jgi:hypothetical protein
LVSVFSEQKPTTASTSGTSASRAAAAAAPSRIVSTRRTAQAKVVPA